MVSPKTYSFQTCTSPAISICQKNFRRLERQKTVKIAPKSYSWNRDSASRAVADKRIYTAPKSSCLTMLAMRSCIPAREWKSPAARRCHRSPQWSHPVRRCFVPEYLSGPYNPICPVNSASFALGYQEFLS